MKLHLSPRYSVSATDTSVLICRARASAEASPTVLPSLTLPWRPILPVTNRMLSISVVLPLR